MEYLKDLLVALSVILNSLPQGLWAPSFGFASVPTALAFLVGAAMALIGAFGLLERIVTFVGFTVTGGMMAGVGIMQTKVAIDMTTKNKSVGAGSIATGFVTYMATRDLVYTITLSVLLASVVAVALKQKTDITTEEMS